MAEPTKTVHRHVVPVDDKTHWIPLTGNPLAVAAARMWGDLVVEFWVEHHGEFAIPRAFQVFGTGHPVPASAKWFGTTARLDGMVWHLFEVYGAKETGDA
ncbi:hypothetical protein [Streptosporangium sp. NPDC002721]|uniref:DUF7352 domain-containing protein n=1 Tax=Streptosporangium sp. NPDC002721 TaxID=3366188 RepID=UPI0036C1E16B